MKSPEKPQPSRATSHPSVTHVSVSTALAYDRLIEAFEGSLGRWDPSLGKSLSREAASWPKVEATVTKIAEPFGLVRMSKIDQGRLTSLSGKVKHCSLYLVGNPVIANQIIEIDLRGSFYVPFRVAIYDDGETNGRIISYDLPSSFLATLGRPELTAIGESLDEKMERVILDLLRAENPGHPDNILDSVGHFLCKQGWRPVASASKRRSIEASCRSVFSGTISLASRSAVPRMSTFGARAVSTRVKVIAPIGGFNDPLFRVQLIAWGSRLKRWKRHARLMNAAHRRIRGHVDLEPAIV